VTIVAWVLLAVGLVLYLLAFAQGAGPTMGDQPLQASLFTLATVSLILGFVFLVVI
jgi:hypothetical protein